MKTVSKSRTYYLMYHVDAVANHPLGQPVAVVWGADRTEALADVPEAEAGFKYVLYPTTLRELDTRCHSLLKEYTHMLSLKRRVEFAERNNENA